MKTLTREYLNLIIAESEMIIEHAKKALLEDTLKSCFDSANVAAMASQYIDYIAESILIGKKFKKLAVKEYAEEPL